MDANELDGHILVIGAAGIDLVGRATAELEMGTSNPGSLRISPGGVARNVAENLARLGAGTTLITVLGEDEEGQLIRSQTAAVGVRISALSAGADSKTGAYLAVLDEGGHLVLGLDDMAAIRMLSPRAIRDRQDLFEGALAIVVDANLPAKTLASIVHRADRLGIPLAADPTSRGLASRLKPHLARLWILSPNQAEAQVLTGIEIKNEADAIDACRAMVAGGVQVSLITRAEFGVSYATSDSTGQVPAIQTEIADPTGAGDALLATVVFSLLSGIPIDESVRLGVTEASLTLRTAGSVVPDLSLELLYDQLI